DQSTAKMTNASFNQDSSAQNQNQAINLGSNHQNPFLAEIKRLIDAHNSYPRMARRMGLSGEVVVRMVLSDEGEIIELRVIESSTHAILDEQTIRAIQEASQSFPKPDRAYILHIPIAYQLNRG
ncbi:MAG: energy transducer TonB, partial [Helicobacter sp.]|nr:energy transducer TonB [Helicobacter sp.]